jgi:hypothetical protein
LAFCVFGVRISGRTSSGLRFMNCVATRRTSFGAQPRSGSSSGLFNAS